MNGSVFALPLMLGLSDGFDKADGKTKIDVAATGKDAAIQSVISGEADLSMFEGSVSDIPQDVKGDAVACATTAVIVNPSSGIKNLTAEQITAIFSGESDDWGGFWRHRENNAYPAEKG